MHGTGLSDLSLYILDIAMNSFEAGATVIGVRINESDSGFSFCIEDNGKGMDQETLSKATLPYFTTKQTNSGLGLSMLLEMITNAGGSLDIESKPGKGTTVTVDIKYKAECCLPMGDIAETMCVLISAFEGDFIYTHICNGKSFIFDTYDIKKKVEGVNFNNTNVALWVKKYIEQSLLEIKQ